MIKCKKEVKQSNGRKKSKYAPQQKYDKLNTKRYVIKLNLKTDANIINLLENTPNKAGLIKALLKEYLKNNKNF